MPVFKRAGKADGTDDLRARLEGLYDRHNRDEWREADPVFAIHRYALQSDREIAGLIASTLAYGRVATIRASILDALGRLGPLPSRFLEGAGARGVSEAMAGFRHRWTSGDDLASLLVAASRLIEKHGTCGAFVESAHRSAHETIAEAMSAFALELRRLAPRPSRALPASPSEGSACKRLFLFARWMVRRDAIDAGLWRGLSRRKLVMPLDVHVHRFGLERGFTRRRAAGLRTALDITTAFRRIRPDDPVRYDFAIAHSGMDGQPAP